jgi:uncharacterized Zn finger protein
MSWDDYYPPYVSVAERKANAAKKVKALQKQGYKLEPIDQLSPRGKIATSFWGHAWCRHLESFSDYESRLPRGRSYARNGAVLHLGIEAGEVKAMVYGSELYELTIRIDKLDTEKWGAVKARCQGKIGSLIELLQGKISDEIMRVVTDPENGLFPAPKEIHFNCNCPDWADMCKHVAAVMYGVGARLDTAPELLFKLRGVDHSELINMDTATAGLTGGKQSRRRRTLDAAAITNVFGIENEEDEIEGNEIATTKPPKPKTRKSPVAKKARKSTPKKKSPKGPTTKKARPKKKVASKKVPRRIPAKKVASKKVPKKKVVTKKGAVKKPSRQPR